MEVAKGIILEKKDEIIDNLLSNIDLKCDSNNYICLCYDGHEVKLSLSPHIAKELFIFSHLFFDDFKYLTQIFPYQFAPLFVRLVEACEFDGNRSQFFNFVLSKILNTSYDVLHDVQPSSGGKESSE